MGLIQNDSPANPALLHGKGKFYKWRVFVVAFIAYASLHAVRTSWGSVKPGVHRDLGWENSFLGTLDMLFLIFYGFGLLGSGIIGDYVNRRRFLTVGMLMAFMGYLVMGIAGLTHSVSKLLIAAAFSFNGLGESTGWPGHVAVLGIWFAGQNLKTIMGFWSTCQPIGDLIGQQLENIIDDQSPFNWTYVILTSSVFVLASALLIFCFEYQDPQEAGFPTAPVLLIPEERTQSRTYSSRSRPYSLRSRANSINEMPKGTIKVKLREVYHHFIATWKIPNIPVYAIAFACVKSANYGILFWLAKYLHSELKISSAIISYMQASYSVGQFVGSVSAGWISDKFNTRAMVIPIYCLFGVGVFVGLQNLTKEDTLWYFICLFFAGICVGGPYNYINGSIAADLGTSEVVRGDKQAAATIPGIIDGVGSLLAAITNKIIPLVSTGVFWIFTGFSAIAGLMTLHLAIREFIELIRRKKDGDEFEDPKLSTGELL